MEVSIVANGEVKSGAWLRKNITGVVIAADGGANICKKYGIMPSFIIGDFDSVKKQTLASFKKTAKIIRISGQNRTDLEKALTLARKLKAKKISVFGALGGTVDHTIANILSLDSKCVIRDEGHDVHVVQDSLTITGTRGDIVSVIAFSSVSGLSYAGLQWNAPRGKIPAGWAGVRNRLAKSSAIVRIKKGRVAVITIKS